MDCPHDDDPMTCPPCRRGAGKDGPIGTPPPTIEARFTARFDGDCPGCNTPVHVGQSCVRWTDGLTRHDGCTP